MKIIQLIVSVMVLFVLLWIATAHIRIVYNVDIKKEVGTLQYTADDLADAIYWSEGGKGYKYGINQTYYQCSSDKECRRICTNTIRKTYQRFTNRKVEGQVLHGKNFLDYLADRYCPPAIDAEGNTNWKKNVRWFLRHPRLVLR